MTSFVAKRAVMHVAKKAGCSEQSVEKLGHITKWGTAILTGDIVGVIADRAVSKYHENKEYEQRCPTSLPEEIRHYDSDGDEEVEIEEIDSKRNRRKLSYKEYEERCPTLLPEEMRHYDSDGDEAVEIEEIDSEGNRRELAKIQPFLNMAMAAYNDEKMEKNFPFVARSQLIRDLAEPTKLAFGITTDTEVHVCVLTDGTLAFAFRGTEPIDWKCPLGDILTDLMLNQVPLELYDASKNVSYKAGSSHAKVHRGFQLAFQDVIKTHRHDENLCLVAEGLGIKEVDVRRVVCIGHSLGGALATLCAHWCRYIAYPKAQIWCVTIGSPRVGNRAFADDFNKNVTEGMWSYRVVNKGDVVPSIPHLNTYLKFWSPYKHVEGLIYLSEHHGNNDKISLKCGGRRPCFLWLSFLDHPCVAYINSIDKVLAPFHKYGPPRITLPPIN